MGQHEQTVGQTTSNTSPVLDGGALNTGANGGSAQDLRTAGFAQGSALLAPGAEQKGGTDEEAQRVAAAQAGWESLLGQSIGGKAFEAIQKHVSVDKLLEYAKKATESLGKAANKGIKPTGEGAAAGLMDEQSEADALNKMLAALGPALVEAANEWLESDSGTAVRTDISQWIEEHPATVTSSVAVIVIGAAVAAWLSNAEVPTLKKMFNINDRWSAGGSIDLGRIQNLSVQAATLAVAYEGEKIKGSLEGSYEATEVDGEKGANIGVAGRLSRGENLTLSINGNLTQVGGRVVASSTSGALKIVDAKAGNTYTLGADGKWNEDGSGEQNVELGGEFKDGDVVVGSLNLTGKNVTVVGADGQILRTSTGALTAVVSPKGSSTTTVHVNGKVEEKAGGATITSYDGSVVVLSSDKQTSHTLGVDGSQSSTGAGEMGVQYTLETKNGDVSSGRLELGGRRVMIIDEAGNVVSTDTANVKVVYDASGANVTAAASVASDGSGSASVKGEFETSGGTEITTKGEVKVDEAGDATVLVEGGVSTLLDDTPLSFDLNHQRNTGDTSPKDQWGGRFLLGDSNNQYDLNGHYDFATDGFRFESARVLADGSFRWSESIESDGTDTVGTQGFTYNPAGAYNFNFSESTSGDQSWQTVGMGRQMGKDGGLGYDLNATTGDRTGLDLGIDYQRDKFKAALDLAMSEAASTVSASGSYDSGDGITLSASGKYDLDEGRLQELGAEMGFRDPEAFKTFMLDYKRTWQSDHAAYSDRFGVLIERALGDVQVRLKGDLTLTDGQLTNTSVDGLAAYGINENWKALGGAGYEMDRGFNTDINSDRYYLQGGVQYKDVGVVIQYDPPQGGRGHGASLKLVIPF